MIDRFINSASTGWARVLFLGWMLLFCMTIARAAEDEAEFIAIFNGRDLTGWDGADGFWRVEDGTIIGQTTPTRQLAHHSYLIWRGGPVDDFELRLSFRVHSGNSGVQYRSRDLGDHRVAGYQCNLRTNVPGRTAILEEMKSGRGGALAEVGQRVHFAPDGQRTVTGHIGDPQEIESTIDPKGWNRLTILAQGNRLIHRLNGQTVVDVTDRQTGKASPRGILALQLHTGRPMKVAFKQIRLRELAPADGPK